MPPAPTTDRLARLFRDTGTAHHAAFAATDGEDPGWPAWYAAHLAAPLSQLLGTDLRADTLAADFHAVDQAQRAAMPPAEWSEYYAAWFLERYPAH